MEDETGSLDLEHLKRALVETQIQQGLLHSIIMELARDASLETRQTVAMRLRRFENNVIFTALPDAIPAEEQLALQQYLVAGLIEIILPPEGDMS